MSYIDTGYATFVASSAAAIARYRRVKLTSTEREMELAGVGEEGVGVTAARVEASDQGAVMLWTKPGTIPMVADGAISTGATVYPGDAGKATATATGKPLGTALEAASEDGEVIEILPAVFSEFFSSLNSNAHGILDDFYAFVTGDEWTATLTDSGTAAVIDGAGGILQIEASDGTAADNDESYVHSTVETFKFAAGKPLYFEARVAITEANTDDANVMVGLMDAVAANSLLDDAGGPKASYSGAVFYKVDGGTAWQAEVSIGGTQTAVTLSTDTFPGDGTYQKLGILFLPGSGATDGTVKFFLDGVEVGSATSFNYTSATEMELVLAVKNGGANLETLLVDYAKCFQVR